MRNYLEPLGYLALLLAAGLACKSGERGTSGPAPQEQPSASSAPTPARERLPPDPPPSVAQKASEVPDLEAELNANKTYASMWEPAKADARTLVLTATSELMCAGGLRDPIRTALNAKPEAKDAAIKLYLIFARVGHYPDGFTASLRQHLGALKAEPHHGVWKAQEKGKVPHDYAALAAWLMRDQVDYFREEISAKALGPQPWVDVDPKHPPDISYVATKMGVLERIALLGEITAEERATLAELVAESKKPREPKLNEEFGLGDFTYVIKAVNLATNVGSGFATKQASEGALFVLVEYTIRNDKNATTTVMADDFRIVDAKGREFRPSSEANTALVMSGGKDLAVSELHPGVPRKMVTAFEMPEAAAKGAFTLVIPEKGLLGGRTVRISFK